MGVLVYLMSIANSNFEEWTIENRTLDLSKFHYDLSKMSLDGALFDEDKLVYFCKEVLAKERKETLLPKVSEWSKEFDSELYKKIEEDPLYFGKILDIEKDRPNPRKDYAKYSDIAPATRFFFDEEYEKLIQNPLPWNPNLTKETISEVLLTSANKMLFGVDEPTWWNALKEVASSLGFAINNREYKANPSAYHGNVSDFAEIIRIALTTSKQSPNLHEIIEILGEKRVKERLLSLAKKVLA